MTRSKRTFDLAIALLACGLLAVPFVLALLVQALVMGRPYFFASERMATPVRSFTLWKLRSMRPSDQNAGVSGGDKAARIPAWGRFLRASYLDEVPQLWNVVRGDMSIIGPRPPLREYVERFPQLYASVLQCRPGLTGLATLVFAATEARLLARCGTAEATDRVYVRRCIPRKARLDAIYRRRRGLRLDIWILASTAAMILQRPGRRQRNRSKSRQSVGLASGQNHRTVPQRSPA
jgi:lipopolysaccharide/colanic/teichoic acid biosynthesis glycosyltransferase